MNDAAVTLDGFVREYRSRAVPPPHILLVGPDRGRSESVASDFAQTLGVEFFKKDAVSIEFIGELNGILWDKGVVFISDIHKLRKTFIEKLAREIVAGESEVVIGSGAAARSYKTELNTLILIGTVPNRNECPAVLMRAFGTIISVDPPTTAELIAMLGKEAWKSRISFEPDAAELLVRASGYRSEILFAQFRRICGIIEQINKTNKPELTRQEVQEALERLRIKIPPAVSVADRVDIHIHTLSGQEFEHVIKSLLIEMGFEAELTKVTGDGGIDIVAKLDKPFVSGRYLFQCKRYAKGNLIGAPEVRDFYGAVMADRAVKGIFITTSDFTNQAKEFAAQSGIELVSLLKLLQLLAEYGFLKYA